MIPLLVFSVLAAATDPASGQKLCDQIAGASVIADDGTFLGKLENSYSLDSILNEYGSHGSPYSSESIWNEYGQYGGQYSSLKGGKVIARLSVNRLLRGALNPYIVKSCGF
jgi:hypothetical protein